MISSSWDKVMHCVSSFTTAFHSWSFSSSFSMGGTPGSHHVEAMQSPIFDYVGLIEELLDDDQCEEQLR